MRQNRRFRAIAIALGTLLAAVLLAAGLSGLALRPLSSTPSARMPVTLLHTPQVETGPVLEGRDIAPPTLHADPLFYMLMIVTVITFICALFTRQGRRLLLAMVAILVLYLLLSLFLRTPKPAPPQATPAPEGPQPPPPEAPHQPPDWLSLLLAFILALALLGAAAFAAWQLLQRWALARRRPSAPLVELAAEAQLALEEIHAGADLRDAVTRCYAEMSRTLREQHDIRRAAAMTAHEFAERLARTGLPAEAVWRITRLFERVRYGDRPPGPEEEAEALSCLQAIVQACGQLTALQATGGG